MKIGPLLICLLVLSCSYKCVFGQVPAAQPTPAVGTTPAVAATPGAGTTPAVATTPGVASTPAAAAAPAASPAVASVTTVKPKEEALPIIIHLAKGGQVLADEVTEDPSGVWYKRGTISTFLDRSKVRGIERPAPPTSAESSDNELQGDGKWHLSDAGRVRDFFLATFNRELPLTAFGQSDLHNRWGWDHRNGMDIGLHPDSAEGRALIAFLRTNSIPFLAFRGPIPGVATGPHIHVGNRSPRLVH